MNENIEYKVFEGTPDESLVDTSLLNNMTFEDQVLLREMMETGHFVDGGIFLPKFLREDLSINLEKFELAITLIVSAMEANSQEDITLLLKGLDEYYTIRGIKGNGKQEREERTFILGFASSVAGEASNKDTLVVKYVQ